MAEDDDDVPELRARLERAIAVRDEFFEAAAHDLRTPLTTLTLQVASLLEGPLATTLSEGARRRLLSAQRQVLHLTRLTERLTDVVRLAASDSLPLKMSPVDLHEVVRHAAARFEDELRWAGCTVATSCAGVVPVVVDSIRIDEVVGNLLTNAGKYAPGRHIQIDVSHRLGRGTVCVVDRGPGIPADMKQRIFEKFERAGGREITGLGLGLWISRRIVEAHGGSLTVEDTPGGGSTFVVELPAVES